MYNSYIVLEGVILKDDGSTFKAKDLFDELHRLGYEFEGCYEEIKRDDLRLKVESLVSSVSDINMLKIYMNSKFEDEYYLHEHLKEYLDKENLEIYLKYYNEYWGISDEFIELLNSKISSKFQQFKEDEYILDKYSDRILNYENKSPSSGQELYKDGMDYLLRRQKERSCRSKVMTHKGEMIIKCDN